MKCWFSLCLKAFLLAAMPHSAISSAEGGGDGEIPLRDLPLSLREIAAREGLQADGRDPLEARAATLERVGDVMSARVDQLTARETALQAKIDRLSEIEQQLAAREAIIRSRELQPPPIAWQAPQEPMITGRHAAVLDGRTMQFFLKKDAHEPVRVASTQKLLTAMVIVKDGGLDELMVVPEAVRNVEPTVIGIRPGEKYTRRQLLMSLLIKSGNDIAMALAIENAGSVEAFATKMNDLGKVIGLVNSNFVNASGLPISGQYSCARDIAIVAYEAYQDPTIREIVRTREFDFVFPDGRSRRLENTNLVLLNFPICNGMKTGYTFRAGRCLVSSAVHDGKERIAVVLGSKLPDVWYDSEKLLRWAMSVEAVN